MAGGTEIGVDFEEETVDEEIVMALPEEGGMNCLGVGVGGPVDFEARGFESDSNGGGCVGGGFVMTTSSWIGLSISST